MNILSVSIFALTACFIGIILKNFSHPIAPFIGTVAIIGILILCIGSLTPLLEFIKTINEIEGFSELYIIMLKALGIALLSETASDICKDCNESSLASKVETAAKISMLILSLPLLNSILEISKEMMLS
ncbi:MAG: hypothetical protein IJC50_07640 [Clostridia bacterium]|nr:hypothetical protein [Clostridia bacterium]